VGGYSLPLETFLCNIIDIISLTKKHDYYRTRFGLDRSYYHCMVCRSGIAWVWNIRVEDNSDTVPATFNIGEEAVADFDTTMGQFHSELGK